jgi:hypothetical protein
MDVTLKSPEPPVNLLSDHVSSRETTLMVHCHDSNFKKVTVMGEDGQALFHTEGTTFGTSWSWRRKVVDSSGRHLYDFRHNSLDIKMGWVVETPDGRRICSLVHKNFMKKGHAAISATVRTTAGDDVLVEMTPHDLAALTTTIDVDGCSIAAITKVEDNNAVYRGGKDRTVWKVKVAAGVDLSLVSCTYSLLSSISVEFD